VEEAMSDLVTFSGDRMRIHFRRFDLDAYALFLKAKRLPESSTSFVKEDETYMIDAPARFAAMIGIEAPPPAAGDLPFSSFLFEDQVAITGMALASKRFACWSGCGQGKTLIQLEFARHAIHRTGARALITAPNEVVPQTIDECRRWYGDSLPIYRIESRAELKRWCAEGGYAQLGITNYEKWNHDGLADQVVSEAKHLGCFIVDENRLKTGGGKQKWEIIKSTKGIEYKLSCTATPAPNDTMEFASQASFLEKMRSEGEIIWTYFMRDMKTHRWTVKKHARKAFFEFMAGWSIYVNDPKKYGWRLDQEDIPKPIVKTIQIDSTPEQREWLQRLSADPNGQLNIWQLRDTNAIQRNKLSQVAKGFVYAKHIATIPDAPKKGRRITYIPSLKPDVVCGIIRDEIKAGAQVLVWTVFDEESDILMRNLGDISGVEALSGSTKEDERIRILDDYRRGEVRTLISRAAMLGWGMNFQFVTAMVFSGWNDSFEMMYQAFRRAYRYGQTERLRVYFPVIRDLEGDQLDNIFGKEDKHMEAINEMEQNYIAATRALRGVA
jgi:hypothetical protein